MHSWIVFQKFSKLFYFLITFKEFSAPYFPDLECCEASGDTLDDAIDNANEAARNWIMVEFEEENPVFPYISDINDIETEAGDIVRNISVNIRFYEGWDE